jgi:hypothetical protein
MKNLLLVSALIFTIIACQPAEKSEEKQKAEKSDSSSFNPANSDAKAVQLADKVMEAHGGQENWNNTRYISWNFLGARDLVWDKYTGNVRIDFPGQQSTYLININDKTGRVKVGDRELTKSDSLDKYIDRGEQMWVNDSYWLVFPFKFKDPGVQLKYVGQDTTKSGAGAEVISLSFEEVGFTPQNKYHAYIDPESHLILQWDFYRNATDSAASFSNEWTNYEKHGDILLSSGRGERSLGNIKVAQEWDDTVFEKF